MNIRYKEKGNPEMEYKKRKEDYKNSIDMLSRKVNHISISRGIIFFGGIAIAILLYMKNIINAIPIILLATVIIFIFLVIKHAKLKEQKKYTEFLYEINDNSLKRLNGEWKDFKDSGEEFKNENHRYSEDLDIFGRGSLFQLLNTSTTYIGRRKLVELLTEPLRSSKDIYRNQNAIKALSQKLDWRQKFQTEGMISKKENLEAGELNNPIDLFNWSKGKNEFFRNPIIFLIARVLPIITVSSLLLAIALSRVPYYPFFLLLCIQIFLLMMRSKDMAKVFSLTDRYKDVIKTYEKMLKLIEDESFNSGYLEELKKELMDSKNQKAYRGINGLVRVVDMIAMRYSEIYIIFNIITLWDYQCQIELERWKEQTGVNLEKWLTTVGEFEALSSLAILNYDHPDWVMPEIYNEINDYEAMDIGHPLLSNERVVNSFRVKLPGGALLITGSNMSGKSTLLRTAGINLVLAYTGAPVCAREFKCSIMDIYTSMRISDNLEKNISSFYAELLRIKMIIEAAKEGKRIFFLLDEIFRGTNSRDRHTGARILIKNLIKEGASGFISTHDLELGDLARESNSGVYNLHFKEYYKDGQIYFDYKLHPGISTTRNAIYLMKMAGIDFE